MFFFVAWLLSHCHEKIPSNPNELKARGDYCVVHQSEQKCKDLLTAIKIRYDDCSKRPTTDYSCQTFKITLCSAFPNFSPCLNSGVAVRVYYLKKKLKLRSDKIFFSSFLCLETNYST